MTRALVAGVAGFLGSNLARELLNRNIKVVGLDNHASSGQHNLESLVGAPNFKFIQASVDSELKTLVPEPLDYIFHLASPASPPKYQKLGLETIRANTTGTENLARLAIANSARLIFFSTSEVYGDPLQNPQTEDYWGNVNPIGPRSVYDESKRLGETIVFHLIRTEALNAGVIRIFNTYGPGMDPWDGRVVSTFIRQALLGEPMTVFGDGQQTRSFCYVDDLVEGIIKMAFSKEMGPINLGNPVENKILELGEVISKHLGCELRHINSQLPVDDPKRRCPDISRAKSLLAWEPRTNLEEGIAHTVDWMKERLFANQRMTFIPPTEQR